MAASEQFPSQVTPLEELPGQDLSMEETFHALAQRHKVSVPRSESFSRKEVVDAFRSAFDLIGGVPRLAVWAHSNETDFFRLYGKLLPAQAQNLLGKDGVIKVIHSIAPGALDGHTIEDADYECLGPDKEVADTGGHGPSAGPGQEALPVRQERIDSPASPGAETSESERPEAERHGRTATG